MAKAASNPVVIPKVHVPRKGKAGAGSIYPTKGTLLLWNTMGAEEALPVWAVGERA